MSLDPADLHIFPHELAWPPDRGDPPAPPSSSFANTDDLSCGPLGPIGSVSQWEQLRRPYRHPSDSTAALAEDSLYGRLSSARSRIERASKIHVWVSSVVQEQILLAWIVAAFEKLGLDPAKLWIPAPSAFTAKGSVVPRIGIMPPDEIRQLGPWHPLAPGAVAAYRAMWSAISAPLPTQLLGFCEPASPYPTAQTQICRYWLRRYPASDSGLNVWDKRLLDSCRWYGPEPARIVGHVLLESAGDLDHMSDFALFNHLKALGRNSLPHPLVRVTGDPGAMRSSEISLTKAGEDVLEGRSNHLLL